MTRPETDRYVIGADIGGSHICSAVVDLTAGIICGEPVSTPVDSHAGAVEILDAWAGNIRQAAAMSPAGEVRQVGFAFPGPLDYVRGISLIRGVRKFDRLYGLDIAESMWGRLPACCDFRFVNDASAFALGECLGGAARDAGRVVALTLGTGVGSGFVENRRLVESGDDVPANGWVYWLPFGDGIVDDAFSTRWVCNRYEQLTGERIEGAREAAERYASDAVARQLFEEYGERLAEFCGPVLGRFRSRILVLGGNIARAYALFGPAMRRRFGRDGICVEIRVSTLMDRAAMIGAASLFL